MADDTPTPRGLSIPANPGADAVGPAGRADAGGQPGAREQTELQGQLASENAPDLGTADGVRAYLAHTAFAIADVAPLAGGTANFVYRLWLREAHAGHATLVLKHAKPYVKDYPELAFELARQVYEVEALRRVHQWLPKDSIVTVPEIFLFDEKEHVIIMEDTGVGSVDLKSFMKTGGPSLATVAQIGTTTGAFLGAMHAWGSGNAELCAAMKGNEQAKKLTAWAFYGRLESTLTGKDAPPKLQDPPLEIAAEDLDIVRRVAERTSRACLAVDDTFVMGDFWPGNLMVRLGAQGNLERIYVVDWELAKAGLHGVELGQFCGEIHLLGRCYPDICGETAPVVLENFFREYKKACAPDAEVARDTLVRWGTHMVVLGARVDWGGKELSREVVLEGLRLVVEGSDGALLTSVVGPLL